jgi:nucleoside-diphosphate kinase
MARYRIKVKRIYAPPSDKDGIRILVDRLWPRGVSKARAMIDIWLKEVAPSHELRKFFSHRRERWEEFKRRYFEELREKKESLQVILEMAEEVGVTLLYSAKNRRYNNAVALKEFIESEMVGNVQRMKEVVMERTLLIIKPEAVQKKLIGRIIVELEENRFEIKGIRMKQFTEEEAREFYKVHRGKEFYEKLVKYMSSGPIVGILIEGEGVIERLRTLVGATDPKKANPGTIRYKYGESITKNAVHASDGKETADYEIPFFFD